MAIRKFKPTSPSRRFYEAPDFEMITRGKPEKKLLDSKKQTAGRNNQGRITSRFRGGGHKQRYRKIDFKRNKVGVPATVKAIEELRVYREATGIPVCFTLDAGPNVHVLYPDAESVRVSEWLDEKLKPLCQDGRILHDHVSAGPVRIQ